MAEKKTYPFVVLDETTLTNGFRVLTAGVDTAQFEKNPVALYLHNDWSMPIGVWENIRKEGGQLLADLRPDYDDPDPEVQRLIGKIERGIIKMASVGLVDLDLSDASEHLLDAKNTFTVLRSRLREISVVPIGKNHNALRLFDREGRELNLSDKSLNLSDFFNHEHKFLGKMKKEILNALNLADGATPAQIEEAVELLLADKKKSDARAAELQQQLDAIDAAKKEAQKAEALQLTDAAIRDGRLDAKAKEATLKAFENDHEGTKLLLGSITKPESVKNQLEAGKKSLELADKSWDELDRAGKLAELKASDFETYAQKFEEKFGKKPQM